MAGESFGIVEAIYNGERLEWVRVRTTDHGVPLRWIDADCGDTDEAPVHALPQKPRSAAALSCNVAGRYDALVLAVSWQREFCATRPDKAECARLTDDDYVNSHFALHGLWPNQRACGRDYAFCGSVRQFAADFCQYPPVPNLSAVIRSELAPVMPSVASQTCLERHEWWKHGSCMTSDPNLYFGQAVGLLMQINASEFVVDYIRARRGGSFATNEFLAAFDRSFGIGAQKHVELRCGKSGRLEELRLMLPAETPAGAPLERLLSKASRADGPGNCGNHFLLR